MKLINATGRKTDRRKDGKAALGAVLVAGLMAGCSAGDVQIRQPASAASATETRADRADGRARACEPCNDSDLAALTAELRESCLDSSDQMACVSREARDVCPCGMSVKRSIAFSDGPMSVGTVIIRAGLGEFVLARRVEISVGSMDSQGVDFNWSERPDEGQTAANLARAMGVPVEQAHPALGEEGGRSGSFRVDFSGNIRGNTRVLDDLGVENFRVYQDTNGGVRWRAGR